MIEVPRPRPHGAHGTTTTGAEAEGRPNRIRGGSTRPRKTNRTRVLDTRQTWISMVGGDNLSQRSGGAAPG